MREKITSQISFNLLPLKDEYLESKGHRKNEVTQKVDMNTWI